VSETIRILVPKDADPDGVKKWLESAAEIGLATRVIPYQEKLDNHRLHNLKSAKTTMDLAIENLKAGYRFDDNHAIEKRKALEQAMKTIADQVPLLVSIFEE
jgi:hypothetical protein